MEKNIFASKLAAALAAILNKISAYRTMHIGSYSRAVSAFLSSWLSYHTRGIQRGVCAFTAEVARWRKSLKRGDPARKSAITRALSERRQTDTSAKKRRKTKIIPTRRRHDGHLGRCRWTSCDRRMLMQFAKLRKRCGSHRGCYPRECWGCWGYWGVAGVRMRQRKDIRLDMSSEDAVIRKEEHSPPPDARPFTVADFRAWRFFVNFFASLSYPCHCLLFDLSISPSPSLSHSIPLSVFQRSRRFFRNEQLLQQGKASSMVAGSSKGTTYKDKETIEHNDGLMWHLHGGLEISWCAWSNSSSFRHFPSMSF